jgi:hypothetical protein
VGGGKCGDESLISPRIVHREQAARQHAGACACGRVQLTRSSQLRAPLQSATAAGCVACQHQTHARFSSLARAPRPTRRPAPQRHASLVSKAERHTAKACTADKGCS